MQLKHEEQGERMGLLDALIRENEAKLSSRLEDMEESKTSAKRTQTRPRTRAHARAASGGGARRSSASTTTGALRRSCEQA